VDLHEVDEGGASGGRPSPATGTPQPTSITGRDAFIAAVRSAILAPSVHNSQPWRFVLHEDVLDLYADRSRQLETLDPTGRLLVMSCGAALVQARLALRSRGLLPQSELLPDPREPDLLARVTARPGPAATPEEKALADALPKRHSQRGTFSLTPPPSAVAGRLNQVARSEGAWVRALVEDEDRLVFATLLEHADWLQRTDPLYREELRGWVRSEPSEDGIVAGALPDTVRRGDLSLREFDLDSPAIALRQHSGQPDDSREAAEVILLGTNGDSSRDWLLAGQALGKVLLAATVAGLQASILGQVVDLPRTRRLLQARIGLRGPVQIALRVGLGRAAQPTPRRPLSTVLEVAEPAGGAKEQAEEPP